ncbi:hypothetical protein [Aeoliella sp. SH292]|uniref:hypothetical protein n=1 Tax=Aeoliella sp. SH292 TaxID=3454464 RepID=UPI003F9E7257
MNQLDSKNDGSKGSVLRITVPGYRERYAASDFTNPNARSLDDQIARYLCSSMRHLKPGSSKRLAIRVNDDVKDTEKESETSKAYQAMFSWRLKMAARALTECIPTIAFLIIASVFLLWLSHRVEGFDWDEETAKTSAEAVRLGAWVSGWTAISLLFTQGVDSLRDYLAYWRLRKMPIVFEYRSKRSMPRNSEQPTSPTYT